METFAIIVIVLVIGAILAPRLDLQEQIELDRLKKAENLRRFGPELTPAQVKQALEDLVQINRQWPRQEGTWPSKQE